MLFLCVCIDSVCPRTCVVCSFRAVVKEDGHSQKQGVCLAELGVGLFLRLGRGGCRVRSTSCDTWQMN